MYVHVPHAQSSSKVASAPRTLRWDVQPNWGGWRHPKKDSSHSSSFFVLLRSCISSSRGDVGRSGWVKMVALLAGELRDELGAVVGLRHLWSAPHPGPQDVM